MNLTISKITLPQIFFILCVAIPYLNNYELTFSIWSLTAVLTLQRNYSYGIAKIVGCFLSILVIAIIVYFFKNYQLYFIIRDITYLLKPILGLIIGYQLCKKNFRRGFQTIVYTGILIAIIHLTVLFLAVVIHHASTVNDLRLYGGYFSDFEVYALIILLFHKKFELGFSSKRAQLFSGIIGFSVLMYLARTNFIQFVILFLALKGYLQINKKSIRIIFSTIIVLIIGYTTIYYSNPKRNGHGIEALFYKIKIAPIEAFKTRINREDWKDFNDNYRSYENITTIGQMSEDGTATILFGKGIGSQVDLKQEVWLGDMQLRYISFLHNAFMTVFLKSGLTGIFIFITSIFLLFRKYKSDLPKIQAINLLMIGSGVFIIFSNWVFMGLYNLLDSKSILIGFFICYREMAYKNNKLISKEQP